MDSQGSLRTSPTELPSTSEPVFYTGITTTQPKPHGVEKNAQSSTETSQPPSQANEASASEVSSSSSTEFLQTPLKIQQISKTDNKSTQIADVSSNVEQKSPKFDQNLSKIDRDPRKIDQNAPRIDEKRLQTCEQPPPNMADFAHDKMAEIHQQPTAQAHDKMVDVTQQKSAAQNKTVHVQHKMAPLDNSNAHAQHKVMNHNCKTVETKKRTMADKSVQRGEFRLISVEFRNPCTDYARNFRKCGKLTVDEIQWTHSSKIPFSLDPRRLKQLKRELMEELRRTTPLYDDDDIPEIIPEVTEVIAEMKSLADETTCAVLSETIVDVSEENSEKSGANEENETVETVETLVGTMEEPGENVVSSSNCSEDWERCSAIPTDVDEGIASSSSTPSHSPTRESLDSRDTTPRVDDVPELLADGIGSAAQIFLKHSIKFNPLNRKVKPSSDSTDSDTCAKPPDEPSNLNYPRSPVKSPRSAEKPENFFVKGANLKTVQSENPSISPPQSDMPDESNAASGEMRRTLQELSADTTPTRSSKEVAQREDDAKTTRKSLRDGSHVSDVSGKPASSSLSDKSRKREHSSHSRPSEGHKKHRSSSASSDNSRKRDASPSKSTSRHSDDSKRHKNSGMSSKKREHSPRDDAVPLTKGKSETKSSKSQSEDSAKSRDSSAGSAELRKDAKKSADTREPTVIGFSKKRRLSRLTENGTGASATMDEKRKKALDKIKQKERQGSPPKKREPKSNKPSGECDSVGSSEVKRRAASTKPKEAQRDSGESASMSRHIAQGPAEVATPPDDCGRDHESPTPEEQLQRMLQTVEANKKQLEKPASETTTGDYLKRQRLRYARDMANLARNPLAEQPKPASAVRRAPRAPVPPRKSPNARADLNAINASVTIDEDLFQALEQEPLIPLIPTELLQVAVTSPIADLAQVPSTLAPIPPAPQVPPASGVMPQAPQIPEDAESTAEIQIPLLGDGLDGSQGSDAMDIDSNDPYGEHTLNSVETVILDSSPSSSDAEMAPVNPAETASITTSVQSATVEIGSGQSACLTIPLQFATELREPGPVPERTRSPSLLEQMISPNLKSIDILAEEYNKLIADIAERKVEKSAQEPPRMYDGPQPEVRDERIANGAALSSDPQGIVPLLITPRASAPETTVLRDQLMQIDQLYEDIVRVIRVTKFNRRQLKEIEISDDPEEVKAARSEMIWMKLMKHIRQIMSGFAQLERSEKTSRDQILQKILDVSRTMSLTFHLDVDDIVFIYEKFAKWRKIEMIPPPITQEVRRPRGVWDSAGYNPLDELQAMKPTADAREAPLDSTSRMRTMQSSSSSADAPQASTGAALSSKLFADIPQARVPVPHGYAGVPQDSANIPRAPVPPEKQHQATAFRGAAGIHPQVNNTATGGAAMLPKPMPTFKQPPPAGNPPIYAESLESRRHNTSMPSTYAQTVATSATKMAQPPLPNQPYPQQPPLPKAANSVPSSQQLASNQFNPQFMTNQPNVMPKMMNRGQVPTAMMSQMAAPPNVIPQGSMPMPANAMTPQEQMERMRCYSGECDHAKPCGVSLAFQRVCSQIGVSPHVALPPRAVPPQSGVRDPRSGAQSRQAGFPLNVPQSMPMPRPNLSGLPPGPGPQYAAQYGALQYGASIAQYGVPAFQPGMMPMQTQTSSQYQGQFSMNTQGVFVPQQGRPDLQQPTRSPQNPASHLPMTSQCGFIPQHGGPQQTRPILQQPNVPPQYARAQVSVSAPGFPQYQTGQFCMNQQTNHSLQHSVPTSLSVPPTHQQHKLPTSQSRAQLSHQGAPRFQHEAFQQQCSAPQAGPMLMNPRMHQPTQSSLPAQQKVSPSCQGAVLMNQMHPLAQQAVPRSQHQAAQQFTTGHTSVAHQGLPAYQNSTLPNFPTQPNVAKQQSQSAYHSQAPVSPANQSQATSGHSHPIHLLPQQQATRSSTSAPFNPIVPQEQQQTAPPKAAQAPQMSSTFAGTRQSVSSTLDAVLSSSTSPAASRPNPLTPSSSPLRHLLASISPVSSISVPSPRASPRDPPTVATPRSSGPSPLVFRDSPKPSTVTPPVQWSSVSQSQQSPAPVGQSSPRACQTSATSAVSSMPATSAVSPMPTASAVSSMPAASVVSPMPTASAVSPMPSAVTDLSQSTHERPLDLTTRRLSASPPPLTPTAEVNRNTSEVQQIVVKKEIPVIDLSGDEEEDQKPDVSDYEVAQCIASIDEELAMVKVAQEMRINLDNNEPPADTVPIIGEVMTITADQFEEMSLDNQTEEMSLDNQIEEVVEEAKMETAVVEEEVAVVIE